MSLLNVVAYGKSGKVPRKKTKRLFIERKVKQVINIKTGQIWKSSRRANAKALILAIYYVDSSLMISYSYFEYDKLLYHTVICEKNFRSDFDMKVGD